MITDRDRLSISQRIIRYVRRRPGCTATQIAHALKERPATVSSIICKHATYTYGPLIRLARINGAWTYYVRRVDE